MGLAAGAGNLVGTCAPLFSAVSAETGGCAAEGPILMAFTFAEDSAKAGCLFCSTVEGIH